jgi:hypothetical protein
MRNIIIPFITLLLTVSVFADSAETLPGECQESEIQKDPYYPFDETKVPVKYVRIAFHVFQYSSGDDHFKNQAKDLKFFNRTVEKVNGLFSNLDPLQPENSASITSPYIRDSRIRILVDTIYFHVDDTIQDGFTRKGIVRTSAAHAHRKYVIENPHLDDIQKYQTLHIIVAGNWDTSGGQVSGIGNKDFILFKGWYNHFRNGRQYANYTTFAHELGHSFGLQHHYGPRFCRQCPDLGCYPLGETNNIMALWPSSLRSLSECQIAIMHNHLDGRKSRGNIHEVVIR